MQNVAGTFVEGLRAALNTPLALLHTPADGATVAPGAGCFPIAFRLIPQASCSAATSRQQHDE